MRGWGIEQHCVCGERDKQGTTLGAGLLGSTATPDWDDIWCGIRFSKFLSLILQVHMSEVPTASIVLYRDPRFASEFWRAFQAEMSTKVHMSTAYHPHTDGKSKRTIQTLRDLLRMCMLDWDGHWADHLSLVEIAYNNNFQTSIGMAPFEALYGRPCRTLLCWTQVGDRNMYGAKYVQETTEKVCVVRLSMKEAQDRQTIYADRRRQELEFQVGDRLLKLPPIMRAFHKVFDVSMLRKCLHPSKELVARIPQDHRPDLTVLAVLVRILERRVKVLWNKKIPLLRV
ncbi:unnamed protein product [Microthlaspi erraticum]|uniref:Integrase catalytic domain-containing protein n=1 Tax=Microthlaspi erraticum TaxID=1685480 RepID=A0A6D2INR2_9BRAS|nr:unnamed protein product [Microthlaspi erraticum]